MISKHYYSLITTLLPQVFRRKIYSFLRRFIKFNEQVLFTINNKKLPNYYWKNEFRDYFFPICTELRSVSIDSINNFLAHRFVIFNSNDCLQSTNLNWHKDQINGHGWDSTVPYLEQFPAPYPGGYDIKVPWELSRCQHFAWLGQAYWLTGDEKYALEFRAQVEDWIQQNPPQYGVNWACTMDVALRAINWLWGYAFFSQSPSLDDLFRIQFFNSLVVHGRHIMNNLEWGLRLTTNHYLSDLVGLVYLGILLPESKETSHWRGFALNELEKEMFKQVYPDGVNFEASTNYHRLSTELFLSATILAEKNGHTFSQAYVERLERMIEVVRVITRPDGTVPIIGDQDNGRVHRLKVWDPPEKEWQDFRPLLAIGASWKNNPIWASAAGDCWEEAIWMLGEQALETRSSIADLPKNPDLKSSHFPDGGWYILRNCDFYVFIDMGSNGQNGFGGHAHNDSLSFDLFAHGKTWIQDPGTYVYTRDYEARNRFRSTAMHNTVSIDGFEQNRFKPEDLFHLENDSVPEVVRWEPGETNTVLVGQIKPKHVPGMVHRRAFYLDNDLNAFIISDRVTGCKGTRRINFHFSPGLVLEHIVDPIPGIRVVHPDGSCLFIVSIGEPPNLGKIDSDWVSMGYGSQQECALASFEWEGEKNHTLMFLPSDSIAFPEGITRWVDSIKDRPDQVITLFVE